jgi:acyl carrier protein
MENECRHRPLRSACESNHEYPMSNDLHIRIKKVIVDELMLQISSEEFGDDTPIFGPEGLSLDSVDALQLVIALEKNFGLKISEGSEAIEVLRNVTTIGDAIRALA